MKCNVNKCDLMELRSLATPPVLVITTMKAVYILLNDTKDSLPKDLWKECQRMMADSAKFLKTLEEYDTSKVTPSMKEKLKVIVERPDFTIERMRNSSKACVGIFQWVMEVYSSS